MGEHGPDPGGILELGLGFWASKTLLSAIELGVFTELGHGSEDYEPLRGRLGLHERSARDFLDALVALRLLERDGDRYSNTVSTDIFLDRNKPSYIGGMLEMANARLFGFWNDLTEALRTGHPQNEIKTGGDLFEQLYADPARLAGFLGGMTGISGGSALAIAAKFPWADREVHVDLGTAQGDLPVQVALAHPHLTGGGMDLPVVAPVFEAYVAANGLADRLTFHPGSFFDDPLPPADVYTMGADCRGWMSDAGFAETYVEHLAGPESMVVGLKAA
jgi:hypothetical protein